MQSSESITTIMPALLKARGAFKAAVKDGKNPHFQSKYVTLDAAIAAVNDALLANDVLLIQPTRVEDSRTILETRLIHASGEWIGGEYTVHAVKNDPQGEGSALTYARRYALMALVGIAPEDDDGNAATAAAEKDSARDATAAQEWIEAINATDVPETLDAMGAEIAKAALSAKAKASIRAAFTARKSLLKKAA